jgi:hypothetical protein
MPTPHTSIEQSFRQFRPWLRAALPQHPDKHRPERPVLLAVDQQLREGPALWVAPEFSDPVGPVEVGQHEDVEQFGAWSRAEGVQAFSESVLELVGPHGRDATPFYPRCISPEHSPMWTFGSCIYRQPSRQSVRVDKGGR